MSVIYNQICDQISHERKQYFKLEVPARIKAQALAAAGVKPRVTLREQARKMESDEDVQLMPRQDNCTAKSRCLLKQRWCNWNPHSKSFIGFAWRYCI